ncbi:hypothetical protein SUGI_1058670 [Cryptomeria japonica]|nr:hypothetical protein SUGI_1058670 [Cryptomeria japonica]
MDRDDYIRENELKSILSETLMREEIYWKDKGREIWIKRGDKNMKFFHASVKARRAHNQIKVIISNDGLGHKDRGSIGQVAVIYFKKNLNSVGTKETRCRDMILEATPKLVTDEDNQMLMDPFKEEGI